ncbi:MAG: diacylglycerol kinase family protein [Caldilineae bacterium]|nr:MAG: diacylglycerol kinase family protein [Caldilineae bacterium]
MRAASVWQSFRFAFAGLWHVLRTQRNARIHVAVTVAVVALGLFLRLSPPRWAVLALTIGVVFAAETMNTVVENLVDLVSPTFHPQAKVAKDAAAGAVLVLAMAAVVVGLLILGPPLWALL